MPIFDYLCQACGHTFDALQKAGEGPLRKCPVCGKLKLKKMLAAPNFHLKGSGWYKTDFRDKSAANDGAKKDGAKKGHSLDTSTAHTHDDKTDSKPDSKPDAKPDAKPEKKADHGHSHSHGGHSHNHGPGGHKH